MADNVELDAGSGGAVVAADDISSVWYQQVKLVDGTLNSTQIIAAGNGTSGAALRVTVSSDSTGVLSVDDNGGSLTVDNGGTFVVQEDGAALTALQVIDNVVHVDDAAFTLGTSSGVMIMGFAGTQSVNANDAGAIAMETDGAVHIHDGGNAITVDWAGTAPPIGAGTEAAALRVTIATDSTGVLSVDDNGGALTVDNGGTFVVQEDGAALTALQLIDNVVAVLGTATYTEASTSGNVIGVVRNDALATLADTDNEIAPLQVNNEGALYITPQAYNSGGCKGFTSIDLDESEEDVATGACVVYSMYFWNSTAAPLWAQLFNTNTVTVGATAPTFNFIIPANADSDGSGVVIPIPACGLEFTTALTVAVTTGSGTDSGAPGANAAGAFILYED